MRMRDIINEIAADPEWSNNRKEITKGILELIKHKKINIAIKEYNLYKDLHPEWPEWRIIYNTLLSLEPDAEYREKNYLQKPIKISKGLLGDDK